MRDILLGATAAVAAALAAACGSSSQNVTSPSTVKCAVTASAEPASFGPGGGAGTLTVKTNRECSWSASADGDWIKLGSGTGGQGDAAVNFSVAANADPSVRRGTIAIGEQQVAITQEAARCTFTVSPSTDSASPAGERRRVTVTASSAKCTWNARSNADWLTIVEGSTGTGNGQVVYDVHATEGPERTGTLTVADQTVRLTQGLGCRFSLSSTRASVGAAAASGSVQVAAAAGCAWTAASQAPWITIHSPGSASGPADVQFAVVANTGPERIGTLAIAGQIVTVVQANGCAYTLSQTSASIGISDGGGSVQVTTAAACPWTTTSNAGWLSVTAGASGSGPGEVRFAVPSNAGPLRTGVLTIGTQLFTVTQASGCTYSIDPPTHTLRHQGESRSEQVATAAGCPWTAASHVDWIQVTAGANSTGPGAAQFFVQQNPGPDRTGTLTVAERTATVLQTSGCDVSLSPQSASFGPGAQSGSVRVTATSGGCRWTAESTAPWMAITAGADGWGSGEVQFTVQPNTGPERTGTLRIAGRFFSVTQAGGS